VGEFWITAFVIVCVLVIVVVPVKALSRGIRDYRQDRRLREMPTPHAHDKRAEEERDQGMA
jgi:hypothetical protein